jgi:hypothetical protein
MLMSNVPPQPVNSFRVKIELISRAPRLDSVLMEKLREQKESLDLRNLTRTQFKKLFQDHRIVIKGQAAKPSSALSSGTTYVDILGYGLDASK